MSPARGGRLAAALLALALTALPAPARAFTLGLLDRPLRLDLSDYAGVAYHLDNGNIAAPKTITYDPTGSGYTDWLNRLQLDAGWGDFTGLIRLDTALYLTPPQAAPGDVKIRRLLLNRFQNRADLEKVAVSYTSRYLDATLGDSYVTYGRGLVLSLRKVDELGVDTTVRGAQATAKVAGLAVSGVAGLTNVVNVDPATARSAPNPDDTLLGARAQYAFGHWAVPGVDVAQVRYSPNLQTKDLPLRDQLTAYSASLELPDLWRYGSVYVEYAQQRKRYSLQENRGTGFYGSATAYLGPVSLLGEYKDYREFIPVPTSLETSQYPELAYSDFYNAPPTLERVQQAVTNNSDTRGYHVRADVELARVVAPFASFAWFDDRIVHADVYDPYAGVEARWQQARSRASVSGGYRVMRYQQGQPRAGEIHQDVWHVEYDVNQYLAEQYSIELDGLHMSHHDRQTLGYLNWIEGQSYLSIKRADRYSVAAGFEYYTEAPTTIRTAYTNISASVNVLPGVVVRLFAGGQRAGIKCVNGVCRNYPAFDGVRTEIVAKY